jgi:tetratricopeptide (TPR) repeat protein
LIRSPFERRRDILDRGVRLGGFAMIVAFFAVPASAQAPKQADSAVRYAGCMELARTDAQKGVEAAIEWRRSGGAAAADHCLATALVARGDHAEGAQLLGELAAEERSAATRAKLYGQAGRAWLSAGDPRRAWGAFGDGLALDPDSTDLLVDRAIANAELGLTFEAIDDLDRAVDLAPGRVDALVLRASAWRRAGNIDLAADDVARALGAQPDNVDALLERGNISRALGRTAEARKDWIAVLRLDPDGPSGEIARRNLERIDVRPAR